MCKTAVPNNKFVKYFVRLITREEEFYWDSITTHSTFREFAVKKIDLDRHFTMKCYQPYM